MPIANSRTRIPDRFAKKVHEFGHFFFAKRSGILVREFAIGMGPKIYGIYLLYDAVRI
jgi:hypothetical protein